MIQPFDDAAGVGEGVRHAARAGLAELRSECQVLGVCLADDEADPGRDGVWRGGANAVYRLRLAKLRTRLAAAAAALDAAEIALRAP